MMTTLQDLLDELNRLPESARSAPVTMKAIQFTGWGMGATPYPVQVKDQVLQDVVYEHGQVKITAGWRR